MRTQTTLRQALPPALVPIARRLARGSRRLRHPARFGQDTFGLALSRAARALVVPGHVEVRAAGKGHRLVTRIDPAPSVPVQRCRNLALLVDALDAAGVAYFMVPGFSIRRHRVAVLDRHRLDACRALARSYAGTPLYVARMSGSGAEMLDVMLAGELTGESLGRPRQSLAPDALPEGQFTTGLEAENDGASPDAAERDLLQDAPAWPWWRVFEPVETPDGTLNLGAGYGVDLEFWAERPNGEWVAPRRNQVTPTLPAQSRRAASLEVSGRPYRTFEPFTVPTVDTVTFPIDVVYTWVDGADPQWRQHKRAALAAADPAAMSRLADDDARFISRDELRYSLRSIEQYAEWVRHVWIVTAGQVPSWLDTGSDRVTVVDHRDIWHPEGTLPTFNSQAIGANLHRIPGLAEHYVYFNDDVFLGRPVGPDLFFHPNGLAKFFYSRSQLGLGAPDPAERAPVSAGRVNRALIEERFGRTITQRFFHTPQALRRSVLEEMEALWPDQFAETSRSTFRRVGDITASSSLHHSYANCTGRATRGSISYGYLSLESPELGATMDKLLRRRHKDTFCLNDLYAGDEPERVDRQVRDFLEAYFPAPSRYEKGAGTSAAAPRQLTIPRQEQRVPVTGAADGGPRPARG